MRHLFWSALDNLFSWVYWHSLSRGYNPTLDRLQAFTYDKRWAAYHPRKTVHPPNRPGSEVPVTVKSRRSR